MGNFLGNLKSRDKFGHSLEVNYKGERSFKTFLGAVITTLIQFLVLTFFLLKIIALVTMSNPNITSYERPMYLEEVTDFDKMYFKDYDFNMGFAIKRELGEGEGTRQVDIPVEFGRFVQY